MKFLLIQLYSMNRSQPLVGIGDKEVQWMSCNLDGYPPEREGGSMVNHGSIPRGQRDNLPEVFIDTKGTEYRIEDIHSIRSS